ncbi:aldo/keto reductase [Vibrio penaeicida]|uniref:aldo/keto reductase n=1 Tax=Vibrio penaeicida TaxID=104609 RepID=UPI00273574E9|nr:aldo/keto reductase [Vibrio penaeicida]MDP2574330.1 aldo/keto reductase [Vibrio penaeicida]
MKTRRIGSLNVSPIGLGCMSMSMGYGPADDATSAKLLNRALDVGYRFLDTASMYGGGHNESLIGETLRSRRDEYVLASKCGFVKDSQGKAIIDGRPETLKAQCEASLKRLKTEVIDLYYLHRLDPNVPIEESVGALGDLVREGKIREIGLSEISSSTLSRAHKEYAVAVVQSEYSLWSRTPEFRLLQTCTDLGVTFVPFSPLGRQFFTGKALDVTQLPDNDIRCTNARPRFEPLAFQQNKQLLVPFKKLAEQLGCSMAQLSLAWLTNQADSNGNKTLVPIPGTKTIQYMEENIGASDLVLDEQTLVVLDQMINEQVVVGQRYTDAIMSSTDSENDRML